MDILSPFLKAIRQPKFLFVVVDYFTQCMKEEAVAFVTKRESESSYRKNMIIKFGVVRVMVFDNGR